MEVPGVLQYILEAGSRYVDTHEYNHGSICASPFGTSRSSVFSSLLTLAKHEM
jgi:hypothetical protein